jgi:predicted mannosyl-3-phosphoglycerate phosphatase (HAD superfamily)
VAAWFENTKCLLPSLNVISNVAAIPGYLGKEHAARWLLSEVLQPALVLGMGDSFVDLPFMGLCHYAMIPSQSQIFSHLRNAGHGFPSAR